MFLRTAGLLCAAALAAGLHNPARAHDAEGHDASKAAKAQPGSVQLRLADTLLRDQDGREQRLRSDVLSKRVAVVNFVYTTCTTVCPVSSATLALLQERLGARLGTQVQLVSITVDPLRDTPARLKEYSARHEAGAGWLWLTGSKANVDAALKAFGAYTPNPQDHPAMTLISDLDGARSTRLYGFPSADELLAQVERALAARVARHSP